MMGEKESESRGLGIPLDELNELLDELPLDRETDAHVDNFLRTDPSVQFVLREAIRRKQDLLKRG